MGGSLVLWRIFGVFGVVYSFFLAWASGATGLTLMSLLYAPGILMYIKGKKERNEPYLKSTVDKVVVAIILIAAVTSLVLLFTGQVEPQGVGAPHGSRIASAVWVYLERSFPLWDWSASSITRANSMIRDISFNSNSANASKSKAVMVFTSILLE